MNPRYVFLDIDGVVLNQRSYMRKTAIRVKIPSRTAVDALNGLCCNTSAVIVVSSTWRMFGGRAECSACCDAGAYAPA